MGDLYRKLKEYAESDFYPYHMPGHKRRLYGETLSHLAELDITEIDGFDNLHDAKGILKQIQEKAAMLYGAEESFFLVNGSTAGILSAISATVPEGGRILMVRGCHKAVYHGVYLRKLEPQYLYEKTDELFNCCLPVTVAQVEQELEKNTDICAVLIVSPTYEGLVADVGGIAETVHKRGIPLIVDSAHGAHLGFHPAWPENAAKLGADLVIESLHKTLPAPTQTAILHVSGSLVNREKLKRFLQIYQTSSPSYLFMSAMEEALDIIAQRKEELFSDFLTNWNEMIAALGKCKSIRILQKENGDIGKLVVMDGSGHLSGGKLYEKLLNDYHLQPEMATEEYVLAMFTVGDTKEAFSRLTKALLEIDEAVVEMDEPPVEIDEACNVKGTSEKNYRTYDAIKKQNLQMLYPKAVLTISEAWERETQEVPLSQATGSICGVFINLYPPGIPLVVPGEELSGEMCKHLQLLADSGLNVQGLQRKEGQIVVKTIKK